MGFASDYLKKQQNFKPLIEPLPDANLRYILVLPAYKEENITATLESLRACARPSFAPEVIVVVNAPENAPPEVVAQNLRTIEEIKAFISDKVDHNFQINYIYEPSMPTKHAGVGLARKIGMDQAIYRFNLLNRPDGVIIAFDADARAEKNYLTAIEQQFTSHPRTTGCSIYFEHDLNTENYPEQQLSSIIQYELFLRYFVQAMRFTGFPFAYHTVGSSFAVRAETYAKQGGMNRKKAGEDFYFLHKIIPLGNFYNLTSTRILLSSRQSDRVPFGTGAAVTKMMATGQKELEAYNFKAFKDLKQLFDHVKEFFKLGNSEVSGIINSLPMPLQKYLKEVNFEEELISIKQHSASTETFVNRFFKWFNAFRIMKFLNNSHPEFYKKKHIVSGTDELLNELNINREGLVQPIDYLMFMRKLELS